MSKVFKYNKFSYYIKGYGNILFPSFREYNSIIKKLESQISLEGIAICQDRISYYCQSMIGSIGQNRIFDLKKPKTPKSYYFDTYKYAQYFNENQFINYLFGDVTHVPELPTIVKSRPISNNNQNSILLKLDIPRHYIWIKNDKPFEEKIDKLIGRGGVYQPHRILFYEKYFHHPLCDLGQVNEAEKQKEWIKPKISIQAHLDFKFILSLQGNDVASNLKWIMSSNSIAVMPKPTIETWFMEGTLQGGKHYIEIKDDYSDLEEKLRYYIDRPNECLEIIKNANAYCSIFQNKITEDYCSLKVLKKYFNL